MCGDYCHNHRGGGGGDASPFRERSMYVNEEEGWGKERDKKKSKEIGDNGAC